MITAQEALYITNKSASNRDIPKEIEEGILNSCKLGTWYYDYQGIIEREIENLLESLGYKVDRCTILGKQVTKISWIND